MKNILLTFLAIVALASCSTPKYAYYFDTHDYQAGKRKKQSPVNEVTPVTVEEIMQAIQAVPPADEPIAVASTAKEIFPAKVAAKAPEKTTVPTLSKEKKRELKSQIKSAIKDYKKQNHDEAQSEKGKNQLVALLLAIFLGFLGIHRFYIGRTGTALIQLALFLLGLFLIIPLYLLAVWVLIDVILIAIGTLTPKSGNYDPEL